jgi:hypothetical protein
MDLVLIAVALLLLLLIAACVWSELRTCQQYQDEDRELRKTRKLNGMKSCDDPTPIELIGSRPHSERPAGVDWTISNWSGVRGMYLPRDRGYADAKADERSNVEYLAELEVKDQENPTIPKVLANMI